MSGERILLVEDDPSILAGLELNLSMEGYQVTSASDGARALELVELREFDLAILDVMLPHANGFEILELIRAKQPELAVIFLTARDAADDKVRGLDRGADDYVTKPFGLPELFARVNAALRRKRRALGATAGTIRFGDIELDPIGRTARNGDKLLELTARELELLLYFARSRGRVLTREQILRNVWGDDYEGTDRTVDNFVARLRIKVERDPENPVLIETVRGVGYRAGAP